MLVDRISAVHRDNYGVYGVRKMWHALRRDGIDCCARAFSNTVVSIG
ncbi:IS3 family transposase [Corynebacterium imitans]